VTAPEAYLSTPRTRSRTATPHKANSTVLKGPIAQFWLERTPDKREVGGSSPPRPTSIISGGVAQLGERLPCTQEVIGSIPFTSTTAAPGRMY
jgi:hypothetical protein